MSSRKNGHINKDEAAYLQKAGLETVVLERRHVIGGAAVTEELIPGIGACLELLILILAVIQEF